MEDINDFDLFQLLRIEQCQKKNINDMKRYDTRREPCGTVLYVHHNKIVIPKELRMPLMRWYHNSLVHAGAGRMIVTI